MSVNHSVIHEITDQEMQDDETQFNHQVGSIEFKPDIIGEIAFRNCRPFFYPPRYPDLNCFQC